MGKMRQIHDLKDLGSVIKEARPAFGAREQDSAAGPGPCRYGTLRPGQHVVMVDSDLEGTVLSLGKKVRVETEDGLVIEAGYSEVAPADLQEERQMVSGVMKPGRREKMAGATPLRPRYTNTLTIDLHIGALPGGICCPGKFQAGLPDAIFQAGPEGEPASLRHEDNRDTWCRGRYPQRCGEKGA